MRSLPVLLAAVLAVTACSGDSDPETSASTNASSPTVGSTTTTTSAPVAPTSTTTTLNPSTSTAPTPTTEPATTDPPTTVATDIDWRVVVETLGQRRQDLYAAPDVSRIPDVCADGSQCADQLNVQIGDLASKGWKVTGADPFIVLDARVERFDGDTIDTSVLVTVVAVVQRPENAGSIVDSSGSVVAAVEAETTPGHNAQGRFLLGRVGPDDDPWRLISQDTLPEVPA